MTEEQFILLGKVVGALVTITGGIVAFFRYIIYPIYMKLKNNLDYTFRVIRNADSIHDIIRKEFTTNGGSSIKDAIKRIENRFSVVDSKHRAVLSLDERPIWETDSSGNYIWVNDSFIKKTGFSLDFLKNDGWISMIHENERHKVRENWNECLDDRRGFISNFTINRSDGNPIKVVSIAYPIISTDDNKFSGYIGSLNIEDDKCKSCYLKKTEF